MAEKRTVVDKTKTRLLILVVDKGYHWSKSICRHRNAEDDEESPEKLEVKNREGGIYKRENP